MQHRKSKLLHHLISCSCMPQGKYFEAVASDIDPEKKSIVACFPADAGMDECCFKMDYDILVLGVGSINNTFGIKGVQEHTFFFKSITDANKLRRQVSECFERAALPNTSDEVMGTQTLVELVETETCICTYRCMLIRLKSACMCISKSHEVATQK